VLDLHKDDGCSGASGLSSGNADSARDAAGRCEYNRRPTCISAACTPHGGDTVILSFAELGMFSRDVA